MPEFVAGVNDCRTLGDAGVVDENIRVAELFAQLGKHTRNALRIRNVTDEGNGVAANLTGNLLHLFGGPGSHGYAGAFIRECAGNRAANAAAAARYQRYLSFEHL